MTEQRTTRRCGNCGEPVGNTDVLCPHCDALLAAYEAPSGSTFGTAAALNPVDMTAAPPSIDMPDTPASPVSAAPASHNSPTAQSLEALDARKPQAGTISTTFDLPQSSPVAEALERTRVAADLDAQGQAPPDVNETTGSQTRAARRTIQPVPPQSQAEEQSPAVQRVRAQAEAGWFDEQSTSDVQHVARQATASRAERSTPDQRATYPSPPIQSSGNRSTRPGKTTPNLGPFLGLIIIFIFGMRIMGSGAITGFLLLPIIIAILIWFMATVAKNTGRKTTSMPKEKNRR